MDKKQKKTINPINDDDKCFQYVAIVALNYEKIGSNSQKMLKIESFISKYNCKEVNYPSRKGH